MRRFDTKRGSEVERTFGGGAAATAEPAISPGATDHCADELCFRFRLIADCTSPRHSRQAQDPEATVALGLTLQDPSPSPTWSLCRCTRGSYFLVPVCCDAVWLWARDRLGSAVTGPVASFRCHGSLCWMCPYDGGFGPNPSPQVLMIKESDHFVLYMHAGTSHGYAD